MRGFEHVGSGSAKFWEVGRDGGTVTVRYGRIGTAGQAQTTDLGSAEAAAAHVGQLVVEKLKKGYREIAARTAGEPPVAVGTSALPDESAVVLPKAVARKVAPFRGLRPAAPPSIDVAASRAEVQELWQRQGPRAQQLLGHPRADPELVERAALHRSGEQADPLGAATLLTAVVSDPGVWQTLDDNCVLLADDIVLAHGIPFAAETAVHLTDIAMGHERIANAPPWWIQRSEPGRFGSRTAAPVLVRLRAHLAAASDEVYAEAVTRLAALRGGPLNARLATSYLAPTERAWVRADIGCLPGANVARYLASMMLASATDPAEVDTVIAALEPWVVRDQPALLATVVANLGVGATRALVGLLDAGRTDAVTKKRLLGLIAAVPSDEAFTALVDRVEEKYVQPVVLEAMGRFPVRAARVLVARAGRSGAAARTCADLLRGHLLSHPEVLEQADALGPQGAAVREAAERAAPGVPVADPADLPAVLVTPPWEKRRRPAGSAVLTGLEPPPGLALCWEPGKREEWAGHAVLSHHGPRISDWSTAVAEVVRGYGRLRFRALGVLAAAPAELVRPHLAAYTPEVTGDALPALQRILARFGDEAVPLVVRTVRRQPTSLGAALYPLEGAEIAAQMADWLARTRTMAPLARKWLACHPEAAARDLVPAALGKRGRARTAAEMALRHLDETGHGAAVRTAASRYGEEAAAAVDAVLDLDPLDQLPARIPAHPAWLDPAHLPPVLLRGRAAALPTVAVGHICTMLALCAPGDTYPGVPVVEAATDPVSLAEMAWEVFDRWKGAGYPSRDGWVLTALALCGNDETVRRLAPLVRAWPGEGGHARAVAALDVLAAIGTDVALLHLHGIAEKVKFKGLRARAQEKITEVAENLGLSPEQLGDRLVPDFGLDHTGSMVLDYGPRRFTVGFDEQLKPVVADQDGSRRKVLPKPAAKDDPVLAAAAYAAFSGLKKDVRTIAADQIRHFERAMVTGRRWRAAEQRALFVEHPLLWHLARRLVWAGFDVDTGAVTGSFRIAEDRTPADAEDSEITLAPDAVVGIAHPLHLGEQLATWSELFADYEILQPFPQLGRDTWALTEQERHARVLHRLDGVTVATGRVLGLAHRGWERGTIMDAGISGSMCRRTAGGHVLVLDLDPGIIAGMAMGWDEQKVPGVWIGAERPGWGRRDGRLPFSVLDEVSASELLRDLEHLRG